MLRLRAAGRKIDDGEAAMPESDAPVVRKPGVAGVGTSGKHALARGDHFIAIDGWRSAAVGEDRVDTAHGAGVYTSARAADRDGRGVIDTDRNVAGRNRVASASVRTHPNDDGVDSRSVHQRNGECELAVGGNLKVAVFTVGVLLAHALDPA